MSVALRVAITCGGLPLRLYLVESLANTLGALRRCVGEVLGVDLTEHELGDSSIVELEDGSGSSESTIDYPRVLDSEPGSEHTTVRAAWGRL
jgi:hypothetical protein